MRFWYLLTVFFYFGLKAEIQFRKKKNSWHILPVSPLNFTLTALLFTAHEYKCSLGGSRRRETSTFRLAIYLGNYDKKWSSQQHFCALGKGRTFPENVECFINLKIRNQYEKETRYQKADKDGPSRHVDDTVSHQIDKSLHFECYRMGVEEIWRDTGKSLEIRWVSGLV